MLQHRPAGSEDERACQQAPFCGHLEVALSDRGRKKKITHEAVKPNSLVMIRWTSCSGLFSCLYRRRMCTWYSSQGFVMVLTGEKSKDTAGDEAKEDMLGRGVAQRENQTLHCCFTGRDGPPLSV